MWITFGVPGMETFRSLLTSTALGVTRPDNKVFILQKLFHDGEVFGIVGKVGIHGDELIVFMGDGILHRHQMGCPQPQLGRAVDHMDSRVLSCKTV